MTTDALVQARALDLPSREAMLTRDPSVRRFWKKNQTLLADAWAQWDRGSDIPALPSPDSLIDPKLRDAVDRAWADPSTEQSVRDLWKEHAPGVFVAQFFDLERLAELRAYTDSIADARIPLRPPYGIALNRGGAMLDRRSEGYLAAPGFQNLYSVLLHRYTRPIARLLFPQVMGYDSQTFGFSIRYTPNTDASLQPHTDASSVTLNINMNRPDETYEGSEVDFLDAGTRDVARFRFEPGMAAIHVGTVPHATHPITAGERSNLVLWLFGEHGAMPPRGATATPGDPRERWAAVPEATGTFAPF